MSSVVRPGNFLHFGASHVIVAVKRRDSIKLQAFTKRSLFHISLETLDIQLNGVVTVHC